MTTLADSPLAASAETLAATGPSALGKLRREAWSAFLAAPLPDRSLHLWRYTDPARLFGDGLRGAGARPVAADGLPESARTRPALLPGGGEAVAGPPAGVEVRDLAASWGERGVRERFGSLSAATTGRFEALNLALFAGGVLVRVAPRARPDRPITLVHRVGEPGVLHAPRNLVLVGEGAEAELLEEYESPGRDGGLVHAVTEVFLEPGARLVHTVVNSLGRRVRAYIVQRGRVEAGAHLTSVSVSLGGAGVKTEASAVLSGPGARSEVLGAIFGSGRQHLDAHFFQDHVAARTGSDLLVRVALMDRARASYTGRLRIVEGAPGCEARQENRNLLLSPDARADSIPELEILTHEVQCSHAASTGPVDPEMLFYLRGRGLDAAEAERMIVLGFLEPVFARVPGEGMADALRNHAARRLGGEAS